jgi:hypothetical protein
MGCDDGVLGKIGGWLLLAVYCSLGTCWLERRMLLPLRFLLAILNACPLRRQPLLFANGSEQTLWLQKV